MLSFTWVAMNSKTSSAMSSLSDSALVRRIASVSRGPGVDLGDQAREETAPEPVLERLDRARCTVRGEDDLLSSTMEVVVGVEELLLEAFFVLHELDVVNEEHVALR